MPSLPTASLRRKIATQSALRLTIGALLTVICLWLLARNIELDEFSRTLADTRLRWVAAALMAYAAGYALRVERWRLMLACENPKARWRTCAGPFFAGYAANNLLPLRAGDIIRALAFSRELGVSPGVNVASLFIERLLDLVALLILLAVATTYFGRSASVLYGGGLAAFALISLMVTCAIACPRWIVRVATAGCEVIGKISPKLGSRVQIETNAAFDAAKKLLSRRLAVRLALLSALIWMFEGLIFWFSALAIPTIARPISSMLALPAGTLGTLMPSSPGFVGTFEYPIVVVMTALGNSALAATAYALLVHAVLAVPSVLVGTPYLLAHRFRSREALAAI